jgi:glutathione synthase/RimK-type ligase-like ATP-grasp enzyme
MNKRRWSETDRRNKESEPVEASAILAELVSKCAKVLKLRLFGLDIVVSDARPYVVDVQEFGGFVGVANAPRMLADFILSNLMSDPAVV